MVDIAPPPIPGYFIDWGFWDYNLIIPVWIWIILILIFFGFVMVVGMLYVFFVMRPVAGYGKLGGAKNSDVGNGSATQVFSIWKNRSFVIEMLIYYGNILAYPDCLTNMQMWSHTSDKAVGLSANKPVMITRDGFNRTVDFIAEMAVCEIPKIFNRDWGMEEVPALDINNNPIIEEYLDSDNQTKTRVKIVLQERKDPKGRPYTLRSFTDIYRNLPLLEKLYPDGIPISIYILYDLSEIYTFTPKGEDSLKMGGIVVDDAKEWVDESDEETPNWLERNSFFIMMGLIGLISSVFCYYAFP